MHKGRERAAQLSEGGSWKPSKPSRIDARVANVGRSALQEDAMFSLCRYAKPIYLLAVVPPAFDSQWSNYTWSPLSLFLVSRCFHISNVENRASNIW